MGDGTAVRYPQEGRLSPVRQKLGTRAKPGPWRLAWWLMRGRATVLFTGSTSTWTSQSRPWMKAHVEWLGRKGDDD